MKAAAAAALALALFATPAAAQTSEAPPQTVETCDAASAWLADSVCFARAPRGRAVLTEKNLTQNSKLQPVKTAGGAAAEEAPGVSFLTGFVFHLSAEHLAHHDERYVWDANYGGEVDLVDYVAGRATFYANYQVIMGEEFHAFDPNQGNYILGGRVSARSPGMETFFVFHHESRHLSDRAKRPPVDWNMVGGRVVIPVPVARGTLQARADLRGVILKSYVDYSWELDAGLSGRLSLARRLALTGEAGIRRLAVDGSRDREAQYGARGEAGIRLEGSGAAVEFYVAAERRVDPYPLTFGTARWVSAGFRILSR